MHGLTDWRWVDEAPLFEVVSRLLALYRNDPASIDGVRLAALAKRLIACEVAAGGPYADAVTGQPDIATNTLIAELFRCFGSPLPKVEAFVAQTKVPAEYVTGFVRPSAEQTTGPRNAVSRGVHTKLQHLQEPLRSTALSLWQAVVAADRREEITKLADTFAQSLAHRPAIITASLCRRLGEANFYTWMAYTIYDDFIDEEGQPNHLPVANYSQRAALRAYNSASSKLFHLTEQAFDDMDGANAWELHNCRGAVTNGIITLERLPGYGDGTILAARASAHTIGPRLIARLSKSFSPTQLRHIDEALAHYLIARQLNDDLTDWQDDLTKGHISYVVAFLLERAHVKPGTHTVSDLIERLQRDFWQTSLATLSQLVINHIDRAERLLLQDVVLHDKTPFLTDILEPIRQSARQNIIVDNDRKAFLRAYAAA